MYFDFYNYGSSQIICIRKKLNYYLLKYVRGKIKLSSTTQIRQTAFFIQKLCSCTFVVVLQKKKKRRFVNVKITLSYLSIKYIFERKASHTIKIIIIYTNKYT